MRALKASTFHLWEVPVMTKLVRAYFSRLGKWTIFRILAVLMLAGGAAAAIMLKGKPIAFQLPYVAAYLFFPHYIGIIIALFNYPLFTSGTIRNQISVGHKRSNIYIADWAATVAFSVSLYIIMTISLIGVSLAAGGSNTDGIVARNVVEGVILSTFHVILFATISQLFCVLLKGVKSFLAIYIGNQALILASIGLSATKDFPQKLGYFLPTFVCMNIKNFGVPDSIVSNGLVADFSFLPALGAMVLETAIVFLIGLLYFRKTDLK